MSHFTVIVVGDNIDELLAPFNEQPEDDSPYLEFIDCTDEVDQKWEATTPMITLPDGTKKFTHAVSTDDLKEIELHEAMQDLEKSNDLSSLVAVSSNVLNEHNNDTIKDRVDRKKETLKKYTSEVPFKEVYRNKAHMARDWFGYRIHKHENRLCFGYFSNPNAKWDWYQIGGRWTGYFKLKPVELLNENGFNERFGLSTAEIDKLMDLMYQKDNMKFNEIIEKYGDKGHEIIKYLIKRKEKVYPNTAKSGEPGLMTKANTDPSRADQAYKRDIDFDGMLEESRKKAEEYWDLVYPIEIEIRNAKTEDEKLAARRKLSDAGVFFGLTDKEIEMGRTKYVKCRTSVASYALLWEGRWYEQGTMGWFGISINEEPQWNGNFKELLDQIPDDQLLTLVDCHI